MGKYGQVRFGIEQKMVHIIGSKQQLFHFLNEKGEPYQFIAIRNDISSRKEAEHRLRLSESRYRELAYHDALTSLPNRLQLITTVNELIADKKRIWYDLL